MGEPKLVITSAKILSFASLLGALVLIYTTTIGILEKVATKEDINKLSMKVDIGFIELDIDRNNSDLQRYDDITTRGNTLTPEQTRNYNSLLDLNKRLAGRLERLIK